MTKIDLHLHSNFSDGSDTVEELLEKIIKADIKTFALTDHDTVAGLEYMQKFVPSDLSFIPAIELTCEAGGIECHILGYNCDYKCEELLALIEKGKVLRRNKLEKRIQHLSSKWNINLTKDELDWLYSRKSVVKTHLANILVKRGLAQDNISAMKKYLDDCKTEASKFHTEEAIEVLLTAGAIPVWAHPLGGEGEVHIPEEKFLQQLQVMKTYGIKGLECYYSRYNLNEIKFLVACAKSNNLLISGGSDYHGTNKNIPIGKLNAENIYIAKDKLSDFTQKNLTHR